MKKILFVILVMFVIANMQDLYAQITNENLIGKWGLVDFDMQPKNKKGKLTQKESETVEMMKKALKSKPKFMYFNFNADGTFTTIPQTADYDKGGTWKLKNDKVSLRANKTKKVEEYTLQLLENQRIEFKAVKSLTALPIMTFEKDE